MLPPPYEPTSAPGAGADPHVANVVRPSGPFEGAYDAEAAVESRPRRPSGGRSSTEPGPSALLQTYRKEKDTARPSSSHGSSRSPYSRSRLRLTSSAAVGAPVMIRAHSMPAVHTLRTADASSSPSASPSPGPSAACSPKHSPGRSRSPFKPQQPQQEDGAIPPLQLSRPPNFLEGSGVGSTIESIQEDSELDVIPQASLLQPQAHGIFSGLRSSSSLRRRPASPLHSLANASQQISHTSPPTSFPTSGVASNASLGVLPSIVSGSNSPSLGPQKYNEAFPPLHHYASTSSFSSISSTPTSARSRSPSISSLDTIEDAPELESEAVEIERIERLKLAAERAEQRAEKSGDEGEEGPRRRSSLDTPRGFGFARGSNRSERTRWSVCGAERRADLDLETIWED